jgi:SAM-dependent methyltransferase
MSQQQQPDWSNPSYWQGRFEAHDTPWDLGHPSIVLLEALGEVESHGVKVEGARVLSPGCGRGSDALELARRGAHVTGVDWSKAAVDALRGAPIRVLHGDMFALPPEQVDMVCEHTFFCAIDPGMRLRYVETILQWIAPRGFLIGNFFVVPQEYAQTLPGLSLTQEGKGPPFAVTEADLKQLFSPYFELKVLKPAITGESSRRAGLEWVGVFQRRS